jgi:hypothetical protein
MRGMRADEYRIVDLIDRLAGETHTGSHIANDGEAETAWRIAALGWIDMWRGCECGSIHPQLTVTGRQAKRIYEAMRLMEVAS